MQTINLYCDRRSKLTLSYIFEVRNFSCTFNSPAMTIAVDLGRKATKTNIYIIYRWSRYCRQVNQCICSFVSIQCYSYKKCVQHNSQWPEGQGHTHFIYNKSVMHFECKLTICVHNSCAKLFVFTIHISLVNCLQIKYICSNHLSADSK